MLSTARQRAVLVKLFEGGKKLRFKKGEFVIGPDQEMTGVYYIVDGLVKAYDITKYGEENLLIIRKKGEMLGLTWVLTGSDRHAIYSALAPTELLYVNRDTFNNFLHESPQAALPVLDMLVDMYRVHSERISNLAYRSVRERLISFLLITAERFGKTTKQGIVLEVPLRHQDIASSISATRETTSRELAVLERQGLISREKHIITLLNTDKLYRHLT